MYNAVITTQWDESHNSENLKTATEELARTIVAATGVETFYPNYADGLAGSGKDANARAAFGENYPRMQEVKAKYDPEGLFGAWFAVRPATVN